MSAYGDKLRAKGIAYLSKGLTKPKVVHGRDAEGARTKAVTDELGNTVTEHNNSKDQVDVAIKAPHISIISKEVRNG
jgi:hypothetical protein